MQLTSATLAATAGLFGIGASACNSRVHLGAIGDGGNNVLWSATFEPGDLSEWSDDGGGGTFVENLSVPVTATTEVAHNGKYAGKTTMSPAVGLPTLSYLFRQQPSPREAYYSAWYYIPTTVTVQSWLSIIHFRGSHTADGRNVFAVWDVNLYPLAGGALAAQLYHFVTQVNLQQPTPIPVPVGRWVHFEVLLRKASDATGRVVVWQDDVQILDAEGVATTENDWLEWDTGSASDAVAPVPAVVYVDDAAISLSRLGNTR